MRRLTTLIVLATVTLLAAKVAATELDTGKNLYLTVGGYGCQVCHGQVAHGGGQAGGYIRGATLERLQISLNDIPAMQLLKAALSLEEQQALALYLNSLGKTPLVQAVYDNDQWSATYEPLEAGKEAQIVIYNNSFNDQFLDLSSLKLGVITIAPLATETRRWQPESTALSIPAITQIVPADIKNALTLEPL